MIEREKTYLLKSLPDLKDVDSKIFVDVYFPKTSKHPNLRLRQKGDSYELTKKYPLKDDPSTQVEHTIPLTKEEFELFSKLPGKRVAKRRYFYEYNGTCIEIDVFLEELAGLVLGDVEFETEEEKEKFQMPPFCLVEITNEKFIAGGMLCGKSYEDIQLKLNTFSYKPIYTP